MRKKHDNKEKEHQNECSNQDIQEMKEELARDEVVDKEPEQHEDLKFKIGLRTSVLAVFVLILAVLLNLLIGHFNISWDMSQEKIYTISDQSKSIVRGLEQDVTIYILDSQEGFPIGYQQILNQYEKESSHIQIIYRDLELYPNFPYEYVSATTAVEADSLIVVCGEQHVYLDAYEYYETTVNSNGSYDAVLQFEPLVTSAINSVNDGETSIIYQTIGHNELTLSNSIQTGILRDNFSLKELSLLSMDGIPEEADIVLINAPTSDFSEEDCNKLRTFMDQGGSVYYIMEPAVSLENLEKLMADYGIEAVEGIVMEQNINMIYGGGSDSATPTYIIPTVLDTEITHDLYEARLAILVPIAKGLTLKEKSGYEVTGLLETSSYAFSKVNIYSEFTYREDDDIVGPFYLAAVSQREQGGNLLVLSSANVIDAEVNEATVGNNGDFFLNGLNYLSGNEDKISIRGKKVNNNWNVYSSQEVYTISGIAIVGIPLILLIIGVLVVILRRRRSQSMQRSKDREDLFSENEEEVTINSETEEEKTESLGETEADNESEEIEKDDSETSTNVDDHQNQKRKKSRKQK